MFEKKEPCEINVGKNTSSPCITISHECELFDMRVKFCNTCEKCLSYCVNFFPFILLRVKSFYTCETILSRM